MTLHHLPKACLLLALIVSSRALAETEEANLTALKELNASVRRAYAQSRSDLLSRSEPIIIVRGAQLLLLHQGERIEGAPTPPEYDALKTVSHVAMGIFVLLQPFGEGPIAAAQLERLQQLQDLVRAAEEVVFESLIADPLVAGEQKPALRACASFLENLLAAKQWEATELADFLNKIKPQLLTNIAAAARTQIDSLHRQVVAWRGTLTAEEWDRLHVIVLGAAAPRQKNVAIQYFSRLLGTRGESLELLYAESIFSDQRALELLGTHLLDIEISKGFFDTPWRMHNDAMGNAAAVYLDGFQFDHPREDAVR